MAVGLWRWFRRWPRVAQLAVGCAVVGSAALSLQGEDHHAEVPKADRDVHVIVPASATSIP